MYTYIYISLRFGESATNRRIGEREERARSRAHVVFMSSSNSSVFDMVFDAAAPFASSSAHSYTTAPRGVADAAAPRRWPLNTRASSDRAALAGVQPLAPRPRPVCAHEPRKVAK